MTTTDVKQADATTPAMPESAKNGHSAPEPTDSAEPVRRPLQPGERYPHPIGPPIPNHPLEPFIGSLKDAPLWEEWQEAILEVRRQMHEEEREREEKERQAEEAKA